MLKYRFMLEVQVKTAAESKKEAVVKVRDLIAMIKGLSILDFESTTKVSTVKIQQIK